MYEYFERELGKQMFHQDTKERLVDIYVKVTSESCKKAILKSFTDRAGCLRIIIASVAFVMGVSVVLMFVFSDSFSGTSILIKLCIGE